jgi:hypothetical protein
MQTLASIISEKFFLTSLTCLVFSALISITHADAQSVNSAQVPLLTTLPSNKINYSSTLFQAFAFPVLTPMQVRVVFENPTFHQVQVVVRNSKDQIIYSNVYRHTPKYYGTLDFSLFPDGEYSIQISCKPTLGKKKYSYEQTFRIHSQSERNITVIDKNIREGLYTKKSYLSGK